MEVAEVDQRRDIVRVLVERRAQLGFRLARTMEKFRKQRRAIDVDFLGPRDAEIERALIGSERILERARLTLQPAEVEPAVGQLGVGGEHFAIGGDRLRHAAGGAQLRCVAKPGAPVGHGAT